MYNKKKEALIAGHKNPMMTEVYTKVSDAIAINVSNSLTLTSGREDLTIRKEAMQLINTADDEQLKQILHLLKQE